jgi:hypothetical protein
MGLGCRRLDKWGAIYKLPGAIPLHLVFRALAAGYGEHLFNQIARDIIAADIAVFETSDLNPTVMLEMGVALTWGVRVLPIKRVNEAIAPSHPRTFLARPGQIMRRTLASSLIPTMG